MVKTLIYLLLLFITPLPAVAQTWYWVGFTDKAGSPYSTDDPLAYLSERAVERRMRQQIPIDELDLPVNRSYISQVLAMGVTLVNTSKWLNGITVKADSGITDFPVKVKSLTFVKEVQITKHDTISFKNLRDKYRLSMPDDSIIAADSSRYGLSVIQIGQLNGQYLHDHNYQGQGMQIAVIDAGFYHADENPVFDSLWVNGQVLGTHDFVNPASDIYAEHYHGMSVLSIMGGNTPGKLVGTAPKASYWLLRSEDVNSEYLIEEDNWAAAAEFADSVGADLINTSLGYSLFDDSTMNHTYAQMDGKTTRVTRAANIAVLKGMLVFASAGNDGDNSWKYINAPADGDDVVAVGAVDKNGAPASFTSYGPASDGDVKPNVAALGVNTIVENASGFVTSGSGTSFSAPVVTGLAACLWQANPDATAMQIKEAVERSSSLYNAPDSLLGYGIPDFELADRLLKSADAGITDFDNGWLLSPNPFHDEVVIYQEGNAFAGSINVDFLDMYGRSLKTMVVESKPSTLINGLSDLPDGLLLLRARSDKGIHLFKLVKVE